MYYKLNMQQTVGFNNRNRNDYGSWRRNPHTVIILNAYKTNKLVKFCSNNCVGEWSFADWVAGKATFEFELKEDSILFRIAFNLV